MNEVVSVAKLQSQIDKMVEAMTTTETGKKMWEEIQRKQKKQSYKEAETILNSLKRDIEENIEKLQTCNRILNTIKIGNADEMTEYSFDRLEELFSIMQDTLKTNDIMLRELELNLKY
jgi:predicted phage tail protein